MFVSGLPQALRCSCTERIVSLRLRLHHWVMARHRTAGHSPLPQTAPAALAPPRAPGLGQQLSPVFVPLRVTHTAVTPHGRRPTHPSSRRSYTWSELIASSGTSLLHELHDDASRVIAAPTCLTQYWLAPAALVILLLGIGHHTADSLYCRITLSSTKQVEAADHSSYVGSIRATRIVDIYTAQHLLVLPTTFTANVQVPLLAVPTDHPLPHISRPQPAVPTLNFPIVRDPLQVLHQSSTGNST